MLFLQKMRQAPARILAKFAKTAPALEIKAGVVEGTFYDANGMQAVAAVPSRDELLSKLLGRLAVTYHKSG